MKNRQISCRFFLLALIDNAYVFRVYSRSFVNYGEDLRRLGCLKRLCAYDNAYRAVADDRYAILKALCLNEGLNIRLVLNINGDLRDLLLCLTSRASSRAS